GIRLRTLDAPATTTGAFAYDELGAERAAAEAAEEDRLLYVAMTRAGERLILSGAGDCAAWVEGRERRNPPPIDWVAAGLLGDLASIAGGESDAGVATAGAGGRSVEVGWSLTRSAGAGAVQVAEGEAEPVA